MSDSWEDDDKGKHLVIPGMALPGFRDLRVQFIALIEFDIFMGPIVHLNEISKGSSYISKLKNYQTVSEVYAGVARADVDILTTPEDSIGIFRYEHEDETDITSVLLISCRPDSDMDPIKIIGSRALRRAKGKPENITQELSLSLREYQTSARMFERSGSGIKIKILSENQITKPLDFQFIKGFCMIDLESNVSDFRYFPKFLDGRDLEPTKILTYLDLQYENIMPNNTTSMLFNGLPLIMNRVSESNIFFLTLVGYVNLAQIQQMGEWLKLGAVNIEKQWRFASKPEIISMLSILERSFSLNSPPEFIDTYLLTSIKSNRLKPLIVNIQGNEYKKPEFISSKLWDLLPELDGKKSIQSIAESLEIDPFDIIRYFEWCRYRHIVEYLE